MCKKNRDQTECKEHWVTTRTVSLRKENGTDIGLWRWDAELDESNLGLLHPVRSSSAGSLLVEHHAVNELRVFHRPPDMTAHIR